MSNFGPKDVSVVDSNGYANRLLTGKYLPSERGLVLENAMPKPPQKTDNVAGTLEEYRVGEQDLAP